ncbi:MarP family serine protease [Nocardia iowensis]|uniref:MarP family serine protease n=1 Tax=Nocardia iowensis TaxID=204891 RepID=A0ABX8S0R3_NOCIO|nr:MarP family serine protease [Nocardia iowensis]QXN94986.1 MarP family serine protease [Nocardia iowensis]
MNLPNWLDLVALSATAGAAYIGWRRGAITAVLGFLGIVAGAALGAGIAAVTLAQLAPGRTRLLIVVLLIVGLVAIGETAGQRLGRVARRAVRGAAAQRADAIGGSCVHAVAVPLAVWMFAVPLTMSPGLAAAVRDSVVVRTVDDVAPYWLAGLPSKLATPLVDAGLVLPLPPPDPGILDSRVPADLQKSVLRIRGSAPACKRQQFGSGFVIAPELVLTNAHVVAGTMSTSVDTPTGPMKAVVVHFDPSLDLAVLSVPGLTAPAVTVAPEPAASGADAIVLGYPSGGLYTAAAARVENHIVRQVPDIYHGSTSERLTYTLNGSIHEGNSGGPVVDTQGRALGLVFGIDKGGSGAGFAASLPEILSRIGHAYESDDAVDTGRCVN